MILKQLIAILILPFALQANTDSLAFPIEQQAPKEIQLLWDQGLDAQEEGNFSKAILLMDSSWCLLQNQYDREHPFIAIAMNHLGNIYFDNTYLDQAYFFHSQALDIRETYFGLQHIETAKSYNNLANYHLVVGDIETAIYLYQQTARIRKNSPNVTEQALASVYNNLGNCYLSLGEPLQARLYYQQSLQIRQAFLGEDNLKTAQSYLSLGNTFVAQQQADSALNYFEKARLVFEEHYEETSPKLAIIYENIGNTLVTQQRFSEAEKLLYKALSIRQNVYIENHPTCIQSYQNIGDLWLQRGDYQQSYWYFHKALNSLLERWGEYHPLVAQAYEQLGLALLYQGETEEAKSNFSLSAALRQSLFGDHHPYVAGSWLNMGNALWQEGRLEEARDYFEQSISIWNKHGEQWHFDQLNAFLNISETYLEEGRAELALNALKKAEILLKNGLSNIYSATYLRIRGDVQQLLGNFEAADLYYERVMVFLQNNQLQNSENISLEHLLYLQSRGQNQLSFAKASNDINKGNKALAFFEEAIDELAILQTIYSTPEARQQITALHQPLFEGVIEACLFLANQTGEISIYHRKALIFSERNKSIRLLETRSYTYSNQNSTQTTLASNHLFLDEDKLDELQARLNDKEAIISFFYGQNNKYIFILNKKTIYAQQLDENYLWEANILDLGKSIIQFPVANSYKKLKVDSIYRLKAHDLYKHLLKPMQAYIENKDHLLIIPDGIFNWLPFEAMLSSQPIDWLKYRSYPYLIHDYTISYAYSISQWYNEQNKPIVTVDARYSCLAVAPEFKNPEAEYPPLEHNLTEAKAILDYFQGDLLQGSRANKQQFLSQAGTYAILHLATHGQTNINNGDYAFLVLADDSLKANHYSKLFVKQLYSQQWKAQLAVLSACETGIGHFRLGEGVISLARGFAQAGVRSSVSSLWKINDAKTAQLMATFYQYLKEGSKKDVALQKAKLSQMTQGTHEFAHPFYWAGYLPYGDMQPLKISSTFSIWWILGGLLLLGGGLFFYLKTK